MGYPNRLVRPFAIHGVLGAWTLVACFPIVLILMNSVKSRPAIFGHPLWPPGPSTFSLIGFSTVFARSRFDIYFLNSLIVTGVSLILVLLLGAMAAWVLSEYRFRGNRWLAIYLAFGIMVPIRLGSVSILRLMVNLDLVNTLIALILVYVAQGLPLAIFILSEFMAQFQGDMKDAARIDGSSEGWIFARLVMPLLRPVIATVAIFTMIPIWNDLWFPLILAPGDATRTVTLGVQAFIGQYVTDWNAVLASLTMAMVPVLVLYLVLSRQLIRGLTSGAVK
jgi:raffinose/stachyose/melibiose transport system permease protein